MGNGETWLQMGLPGQVTTISLAKFQGIVFETDDIEKEIGLLKVKGIQEGQIDPTPWGRFAWLQDPAGNKLCLHQK